MEVAEHLPPESAEPFVDYLCQVAGTVLFSAAIPGQAGEGHVNLRWQSYWAELFAKRGYECLDVIRPSVWAGDDLPFWYSQNTLLYSSDPAWIGAVKGSGLPLGCAQYRDIVHPRYYTASLAPGIKTSASNLGFALRRKLQSKVAS